MRYAWIETQRDDYPLELLCRSCRSHAAATTHGVDASRRPPPNAARRSPGASNNRTVTRTGRMVTAWVHQDLIEEDEIACCRETVRQVRAELGLSGQHKRRFVTTTDSNHADPVATDRLQRDFTATRPDQMRLADITYLRLAEGWPYLAVVLDCFSRPIVGWSLSRAIDAELVCDALAMALWYRCPQDDLVHHSDRGVQYASQKLREKLAQHHVAMSMSRKGDPWDNAMMESFFGSLKTEWVVTEYATEE